MAAHAKVLPHLLQKVLEDTKIQLKDIDVVAATRGPGLPGCVSVGYNSGRCIAAMLSRPFIGVHHMVRGKEKGRDEALEQGLITIMGI